MELKIIKITIYTLCCYMKRKKIDYKTNKKTKIDFKKNF